MKILVRSHLIAVLGCLLSGSVAWGQVAEGEVSEPTEVVDDVVEAEESPPEPGSGVPEGSEGLIQRLAENELASKQAITGTDVSPERTLSIRTAVYNLELQGIPESMGRVVTDALLAEVRKLEGISAIGMEEITQMISLEAQKQMMGCEASESCLAQIAGALGVDELITGNLIELIGTRVLTIRRID